MSQKSQFWSILATFCPKSGQNNFFSKIGLGSCFSLIISYYDAKNQKNPMSGSMITLTDGLQTTDYRQLQILAQPEVEN